MGDAADAAAALRRRARSAAGVVLELPGEPSSGPGGTEDPLPLPAPRNIVRALTGSRTPSLDAFAPRRPRPGDADPLLLMPVGSVDPGSWTIEDAAALVAEAQDSPRTAHPDDAARFLLVATAGERRALRAALRRLPRRARRTVVMGTATDDDSLAHLLTTVDAVFLPCPRAASVTLREAAAARGRSLLGPSTAAAASEAVADEGRAARLEWARRRPAPAAWTHAVPRARVLREARRVVVAGHDLKFARGLIDHLTAAGHEVRVDPWHGHARHEHERSQALARWADVVHCEWSLGNLVWYSRHLPADTRLTSRLHLQEAATAFPGNMAADALDAWIFVAPHVRDQTLRDTGFPAARAHWIPNAVDVPPATAQTLGDDRRFVLGLVGVLPERKGLHRALDVLSLLRSQDPRYSLRIRGHRPREVAWMDARPGAQAYYAAQEDRIAHDPALGDAVTWDPHGPDMASWFSRVGVALSTSDFESFHFTLPDGAVHGCVPRSLAWAGADRLYPTQWLAPSTGALAASVQAATADALTWKHAAAEARETIAATYDEAVVLPRLAALVLGDPAT